jgi:ATP-binding cassette subfamily C protein CydC
LLTRAWDPVEGRVLISGKDVREYALRDLRAALGVVMQDTYIFNDTIRHNLLLARPDASTSELEAALQAVEMLDLVRDLPQGINTWVGEHGQRLSEGERQRLAVARVLLQDAPIVVLDEVTANLDPLTERALLDMLYRVTEGRTVLVITHRLVGLERMHEIVALDRGRVVERATHDDLFAARGLYRRMLDVQENMLAV